MKSTSGCTLLVHLWLDHPGQPTTSPKEEGKKKKKGGGKTVSSVYLVSLGELMTTLHNCEPHFVRCLVPNTHKKPGEVLFIIFVTIITIVAIVFLITIMFTIIILILRWSHH